MILAKTCMRLYFYRIVLGFVPRAGSAHYLGWGSTYHKFREVLDRQYLALATDDKKKLGLDPEWQMVAFQAAVNKAMAYWDRSGMKDPIVGDKWDFQTKARMLESCVTGFKYWQRERQQGRIEILAVEQNFIVPLPDGTPVGGKADVILRWNNQVWGRDYKTSSKEQNQYFIRTLDPNDQFTRYTWAESELSGERVQGLLVEVLYNGKGTKKQPKKGPEIFSHMTSRSTKQIEQWVKEQMFLNEYRMKPSREQDIWPMEEKQCPYCPFHSVCKTASEFGMMAKLEAEFKQEPWDCTNRDVDLEGDV